MAGNRKARDRQELSPDAVGTEKPISAAKAHFQAVLAHEPQFLMETRHRAIESYKKTRGRQDIYDKESVLDEMLTRMANGESLNSICNDSHMPSRGLVYYWKAANPSFAERFARAQESQAHCLLDDTIAIADGLTLVDDPVMNSALINQAKMRIDTRLRAIAKMAPDKFGDKIQHTGANGGPIQIAAVTIDARSLAPDQRDALREALLAAKAQQNQAHTIDGTAEEQDE